MATYELPHATFVGLEQEATSMKVYHSAVIPGLLQTGDYVRALHDASTPDVDPGVIEQRIEERMRRQELLDRDNYRASRSCWTKPRCTGRSAARPSCAGNWTGFWKVSAARVWTCRSCLSK